MTLSQQQADWAQRAIAERGLQDRAEVRFLDYRDVAEDGFDAVSSIGLTEHIGARNLGSYFRFLAGKLRPEGRMLNHSITRPSTREQHRAGGFIDRYVFPDGELEGVGTIISAMQDHGLEVRHEENLREHYAMTLRDWWRQPRGATGTRRSRRSASAGRACGSSTWRRPASGSSSTTWSCTRCSESAPLPRDAPGCPCDRTGSGPVRRSRPQSAIRARRRSDRPDPSR